MTMESFEVEEEADCSYDYLEIKSYGAKTVKKCTTVTQKTADNTITVILPGKLDEYDGFSNCIITFSYTEISR